MTLVAAPVGSWPMPIDINLATAVNAFTFDASTDLLAQVFYIPLTGTLNKIHYRIASVSTPAMTHRIELRTVDAATGLPNAAGTLYGSSTTITVDASTYAAGNYTAAVAATATVGDLVAAVFDLSAFTSGSFTQRQRVGGGIGDITSGRAIGMPYTVSNTTGTSSKSDALPFHACVLEYSSPAVFVPYGPIITYCGDNTATTVTSSGAVRRAGNKFTPVTKRRAIGIVANAGIIGNCIFRLRLQSDDSILATATVDKDNVALATTVANRYQFLFDSGATYTPTVGTAYYITMEGNDASGGTLRKFTSGPSNAALGALPGGTGFSAVTHDGTSYSATDTDCYNIALLTDQEDDGASAGGIRLAGHGGLAA